MTLTIHSIASVLPDDIPQKNRERFEIAFRSLSYQSDYCRYHYEQFKADHKLHQETMRGQLHDSYVQDPQFYRIRFEANGYAFFRALHAMIESLPYLLNIILGVEEDTEKRNINWKTITDWLENKAAFEGASDRITTLKTDPVYEQLQHLVNVTKHRRIPRIDSGTFLSSPPRFCPDDLDIPFDSYNIVRLMETSYDNLHPQVLDIIRSVAEASETTP